MTPSTFIELFGYLGSVMVVVSMLMSSVVKLRIINAIGSIISGTYALIIGSFPLALMNLCLVIINVYNLYRLHSVSSSYEIVACRQTDPVLTYYLEKYQADISVYFPDFSSQTAGENIAYMIFSSGSFAGIFLGAVTAPNCLDILLDYSAPAYRDCSVGKFLYKELAKQGWKQLQIRQISEKHAPYLQKMGYLQTGTSYRLLLSEQQ